MADPNFFPGFEDDETAKKPAKPAAAPAPAKPAFNPFADAAPAAPAPSPVAPAGPVPRTPLRSAPPPPPANDDPELKPGSRKDLWKCPHCGTGNKPDRDTCRSCGKRPSDPVVVPWHSSNLVRGGIAAAVIVAIVLAVMLSRTDLSLREPGPAGVDRRPRLGGSADTSLEVASGLRFSASSRISVSGRVVATKKAMGITWVALALKPAATDEAMFTALKASDAGPSYQFDGGCVLACIGERKLDVQPGDWLSLSGEAGDLIKDAGLLREAEGTIAVSIDELRTAKP